MTTTTTGRPGLGLLLVATATLALASVSRLVHGYWRDFSARVDGTRARVDEVGATLGGQIRALETTVLDAVDEVSASRPRRTR